MVQRRLNTARRAWGFTATAFALAMTSLSCGHASADQSASLNASPLFGTAEFGSHDLEMFPKWRHTLQAFEEEVKHCRASQCDDREWQATIVGLRGKDLMTQLRETNLRMNEKRYIVDAVNWAMSDYWATPFEFLRKGGGDCEDYAIAKYMVLRNIGIAADDMRVVVLKDVNLQAGHAVLAVYVKGTPYILDNRSSDVVPASSIHRYQPIYSINEHGWWLHRRAFPSSTLGRDSEKFLAASLVKTKMPAAAVVRLGIRPTFAVQLASLPTGADATRVGAEIEARYSAVLEGPGIETRRVDLGAKGIWYRVLAGQFGSRNTASDLCAQLRTASPPIDCIVIAQ
jgi:predicted transglutaminase-like cysteine proteinase